MSGIVYMAKCYVNGKRYVGATRKRLKSRITDHASKVRHGSQHAFHAAIREHGIENFEFYTLEAGFPDKQTRHAAERRWIFLLVTASEFGYNWQAGGEGSLSGKRSEAWNAAVRSDSVRESQSARAKRWRASMTPGQREEHQAKINAKIRSNKQ